MTNKILAVVHQETSSTGLVGELLQQRGYDVEQCCPALGDRLPMALERYAGAMVFGGPMSANDEHLPFIRQELDWLPQVLAARCPFLGICLGAQLLSRVLGGQVGPHPEETREIGYFPIRPTAAGQELFGQPLWVYHWHGEGFEVPDGAVQLAEGDLFPNQAFRYERQAYGLQFHPEMTQSLMVQWIERAGEQLIFPGAQSAPEHFAGQTRYGPAVEAWLNRFLDHWLGLRSPTAVAQTCPPAPLSNKVQRSRP